MELNQKKCKPCEGGIPALSSEEIQNYAGMIKKDWRIVDGKQLEKEFHFVNFVQTINFVNRLAELAEEEGHHPVMHVYYGKCNVELWTYAIGGLSENDFILAAKIDSF